jgi:hypothetical protein
MTNHFCPLDNLRPWRLTYQVLLQAVRHIFLSFLEHPMQRIGQSLPPPRRLALSLLAASALPLFFGCSTLVTPGGADATPPLVKLGSLSTVPEGSAQQSGTWIPLNAAGANGPNPSFVAQADDPESGINSLMVTADVRVWCVDDVTALRPNRRLIEYPLQAENSFATNANKPTSTITALEIPMAPIRASCIGTVTPLLEDFQVNVMAKATNGQGQTVRSGQLGVVFGPTEINVVVHNLCIWCRNNADRLLKGKPLLTAADFEQIKDDAASYWGSKDLVLLNEAADRAELEDIVARMRAAGLGPVYFEHFEQTAIVSRWPLLARRTSKEDGWWIYPDGKRDFQPSYVLRAVAMMRGRPFDVYSVYWQHQPAPATHWGDPQPSADSRRASAHWMRNNWQEFLAGGGGRIGGNVPRLIGGDFNSARMRFADPSLSNPELRVLIGENKMAAEQARVFDQNYRPTEPWIDLLFVSGPWKADVFTDRPDLRNPALAGRHFSLMSDHPVQEYVLWRVKE